LIAYVEHLFILEYDIYNLCTDEEIIALEIADELRMTWILIQSSTSKYPPTFILKKSKVSRASFESLDSHLKIVDLKKVEPIVDSVVSSTADALESSGKAEIKKTRILSLI